jgi:hypothetical protein
MLTIENLKEFLELQKRFKKLEKKANKYKWLYCYEGNTGGGEDHYFSVHRWETPGHPVVKEGWGILTPKGWIWQDLPFELYTVKNETEEYWMTQEIEGKLQGKFCAQLNAAIEEASDE